MEKASIAAHQVLYEVDTPITHVWFPISGVLSLTVTMKNEATVEVATIGNEGLVGLPLILGVDRSLSKAVGQVPGQALKMRADLFKRALQEHSDLQDILKRYTQAIFDQITQSAACAHLHSVEQRMCRWLLMTHDRVGGDELRLTQDLLAQMLAVRRPSVTVAAGRLQRDGLIKYQRGRIRVLDRAGLENSSCECYETVRHEFDKLINGVPA
jgi:CRP-like cAMP-binding protein